MSNIVLILLIIGVAYLVLFNKPKHHSVDEISNWFDNQLSRIAARLESDIELDRKGEYPHAGRDSFETRGKITYTLLDKKLARFDITDRNEISRSDISSTDGYRELESLVQSLGYTMTLDEVEAEGDEVDDNYSLDEHIDDFPRYYTVKISGW